MRAYIVEAMPKTSGSLYEFDPAYYIIGAERDINNIKKMLCALALSGLKTQRIELETGYRFISGLINPLFQSTYITQEDRQTFESLVQEADLLIDERLRTLTQSSALGQLSVQAYYDEVEILNSLDLNSSDVLWLTMDGLFAKLDEDNGFRVVIEKDLIDAYGKDSPEAKIAAELGLSVFAAQFELIPPKLFDAPRILSDKEHTTLGYLDEQGFQPVVTVLGQDHPIRQQVPAA